MVYRPPAAYRAALEIRPGGNEFRLTPEADFTFSTADSVFYGYVKVADDPRAVDIEALRDEVSGFETMIYPEAYFEEAAAGGGCPCCGGG